MIVWYPLLKLLIVACLLWWAVRPILSHYRLARAANRTLPLPTEFRYYWRLIAVLLLIALTPFRLQSPQQLEKTVQTYDTAPEPPAYIKREPTKPYRAPDHQSDINDILNKD